MIAITRLIITLIGVLAIIMSALFWYIARPPDLGRLSDVSAVLRGTDGRIINLTLTNEGYWREQVDISDIDP